MHRTWSLLSLVLLLAPGCAASRLLGYQLSPDYPDDAAVETLQLPGLKAPVSVVFDAQGVPHVEAQNLEDLARASGFVQGRARFFQMDMMRRLARGRVSEIVGEQPLVSSTTAEYDKTMRGWEIERRATGSFDQLSERDRALITAFAAGVNASLAHWTPLEYRLLGLEPEPWQPQDSLAVGLLNIWSITHNYQQEAVRLLLAMSVGVERMQAIYPAEPLGGLRTVATSSPAQPLPPSVVEELDGLFPMKVAQSKVDAGALARATVDVLTVGGASNAWVVSGERSASGKPLLANDPHLSHFLPGLLLQLHLVGAGRAQRARRVGHDVDDDRRGGSRAREGRSVAPRLRAARRRRLRAHHAGRSHPRTRGRRVPRGDGAHAQHLQRAALQRPAPRALPARLAAGGDPLEGGAGRAVAGRAARARPGEERR